MSVVSDSTARSCGVTTIKGRRSACAKPAMNNARALPDKPDTTTFVSPRNVSEAMRRKSATAEMRPRILLMRFSRSSIPSYYCVDDPRRRMAIHKREGYNFSTPAFDFLLPHDVCSPVRALHKNIRSNAQNCLERCVFIEGAHEIDHLKCIEQFCTFRFRNDGTL